MNSWNLKSMTQVIAYLLLSRNDLICDKLLKNIMFHQSKESLNKTFMKAIFYLEEKKRHKKMIF